MPRTILTAIFVIALLALQACGKTEQEETTAMTEEPASVAPGSVETASAVTDEEARQPATAPVKTEPYVVEYRAVGKTFQGPTEIPSGWTTFRFVNASPMLHFGMIDVPPEEVSMDDFKVLMSTFQEVMDALNAVDEAAVNEALGRFPEWVGELGRNGGPGMLSPGLVSETTVYMEPGRYVLECYIKSDGVFHTTPLEDGSLGMVLEFTVTGENNGAPEPEANAVLAIRNNGFEWVSGELTEGANTIRVDFIEQQALPSFVGNDVHVMKVENEDSIRKVNAWMDWRTPIGLEDPAPAVFLGGINDMPAGSHGYFSVDLEPGEYAFIAEIPDPGVIGFILPFTIASSEPEPD